MPLQLFCHFLSTIRTSVGPAVGGVPGPYGVPSEPDSGAQVLVRVLFAGDAKVHVERGYGGVANLSRWSTERMPLTATAGSLLLHANQRLTTMQDYSSAVRVWWMLNEEAIGMWAEGLPSTLGPDNSVERAMCTAACRAFWCPPLV